MASDSLRAAREAYPLLADTVKSEIDTILAGRPRRRGGRSFLLDAFDWEHPESHERLALLEQCLRDFSGARVSGLEEKMRALGRADREEWVSLYSELTIARALVQLPAGRLVAFDPSVDGARRCDFSIEVKGVRTFVEVCAPRPPPDEAKVLDYPDRLWEALKRVEAGVTLEILGLDRFPDHSALPRIPDLVKGYRGLISHARAGDILDLGGPVKAKVVMRYPTPQAVSVGGGVPSILIGDGARLAEKIRRDEARQLPPNEPGLVIADLSSQGAFILDEWDAGLAEARDALAKQPPRRGDAVIAVRSPTSRSGMARFPRLLLWRRAEVSSALLDAIAPLPVRRPTV